MEGDCEGLVAIVQGLDTSGVTLTVCNRARHNSDRRRSSRSRIQISTGNTRPAEMPATDHRSNMVPASSATLPNQRSSVETSTGTDFARQHISSQIHTSSQICDGRYASSYRMAHCMLTPTSPPEAVSEFPPQRREPCRNQGNFEIGGHCSGHSSGRVRVSTSRARHYGGSQTWGDKGSSHRYCKSNRDTEAFVHSLRKYPSMAPFRIASSDLIEKLIRYTQGKNLEEMSRSSKSMRSLRHQKSCDTFEMTKASKHQQTYTRRQDNNVNNSNVQVGYKGRVRNYKLYSPMSDSRNLKENRHRETKFSSSYDYLKAGVSPYGRPNRSDECPSPVGSSSPERTMSPERSRSPDRLKSPEVIRSPVRFKSVDEFKNADGIRSPDRLNRADRPLRFQRSARDVNLSDMSKYIRSTIKQFCNERPVVLQVCPKLKNRYNQHKKVCPSKSERANGVTEDELDEDQDQASGSVISRLIQSFSGCAIPSTEQAGCQCTRTDCYCTKATQCVNNPDASTNTHSACSCKIPTKIACCRGMPCACASKSQDQAYYNKRIDDEIAEWLKDVPVHSIEGSDSKKKRDTVIKELRKTLKQLPDDENYNENARNEIKSFIEDFPLWNPGKDRKDEKLFKNQVADKLTERILSVPRKPDRFRDIVKKWVANMDFEDDGEEVDKESIIDKFVNKLKSMAVDRPACDVKYTHTLRKEIIELLVELALKFDGDMVMLKKMANKFATEIVSIPRNVNLSGDTTDLTDEFGENVSDWICEHGLCGELKKDPKLIEGLARKLNKLKSQGIDDECVVEKMKEEIHQFVDDVGIAIETIDELVDELMKQLSNTVQTNEMEKLDQDELTEIFTNWLSNLPGASDLHPRKFEKIIKELVKVIKEGKEQGNENLANDILTYLVDADLGIDPADLSIQVDELMEKLNLLPSNKYHKEQIKKAMIKDILDIIENLPVPESKKKILRNKAHQIVEEHLLTSSLNSKESHDDMRDAIMENLDDAISDIDIPKESLLRVKASISNVLNSNLEKSFMRLTRLSREGSNLKQTIAKDVRNAVKELPIDTDKKKDLMQQVKGTLSKNMHKPLPSNVKNTINNEISDIVERCPISEDNSILGSLKKLLSAVASKHLNICVPKCVCDIQDQVEKAVGIVIDRSSIDTGKKKELKKSIQDILTENEDRQLSDEVLKSIKEDISGVVSDLSIPQDKKDVLKKTVGETISKDFNEALSNLRHDLNKIRNKLFDDICNIIEKSPISRNVKAHLKNKLKSVLARNLDSSLSDEEKYTILDDVSNIIKDDMPEEKRRSLTNKLAKKLDTQQRKEDTIEIDELTENLKELENKILEHILRKMEQAIEEAPIPREKKNELRMKLKDMGTIDYKKPADEIAEALTGGINEILNELNLPIDTKNELKSELAAAIDEYSKLLKELNDVGPKYIQLKRRSSTDANGKQKINGNRVMPIGEFDEAKAKESILQGIEDIIQESAIPEKKNMELKRRLKKISTDNLKKPFSDDVQDAIKIGIADILDELQVPKAEKNKLKRALMNMTDDCLDNLRAARHPVTGVDQTKAKASSLKGIENTIKESAIPEEKKMDLERKFKKMATDNLKKPFSDDVQDAIDIGIADILDELQAPTPEKNKLKRALMSMTDDNLDNLRAAKQPVTGVDQTKAKESILKGIERIIKESAIPEEKKMELKRKLTKMAADNLEKPFSDDVQDAIKIGIADIIDELQAPTSEKNKLKRALMSMTDDYLDNLRAAKQPVTGVDQTKAKASSLKGIENTIKESAIPEEKKMDFERKFKKMATDNLKKPFSDDVQDAIDIGIADILDELQAPTPEKNKLKRALMSMTDDNLDNLRAAKQPVTGVDQTKAKESILKGIERIIKESAIPEEKKMELKRKLTKMAADNLEKPFSDDVQDAIKIGIADIIDDLQIPKPEKDKLKRALMNMTDEIVANLRDVDKAKAKESVLQGFEDFRDTKQVKQLKGLMPIEEVDETNSKESILQGIEKIIAESAIPEEKKMELKRKLKNMATDNLKKPFSEDVKDAIKIGIADILDELQLPKSEKNKLKRALLNMVDKNVDNLQDTKPVRHLKGQMPEGEIDGTKARERILQGIEKIIEDSAIPEEKKMELKRKLKNMATDNLKKPFSEDVKDAIKMGMADILDDLQIPKSEKNKLKRALINMADENLADLPTPKLPKRKNITETQKNMLLGVEKAIDEAAIPIGKKKELKEKLRDLAAKNLQTSSDDFEESLKDGIHEIMRELNSPKGTKPPYAKTRSDASDSKIKGTRSPVSQKPLKGLMPIEEVDKTNAKESILQGIDKIIEESAVPENKKRELKEKLKKMATENLKKPFSDDVQNAMKIGIADILDELQVPSSEKNKLKRAILNMVDENVGNIRGVPFKLSSQAFKELEIDTQNNILLGFEKAINEAPIPLSIKKELKKKLKDTATKNFQKSLSDDTAEALKDSIDEILDELNLPKDQKNKLKSELTAAVDENLSNFKNEINLAKSMPDAKRNKLNIIIRRVLPQFDEAVDPGYQKQLAEEFDELLEIARTDGDFNDVRRKLIKKLMREKNLTEKEASAPVDELIGRARELALKEERYELDPSYVKTLEADINDLVGIALVGGNFEDARRKLIKKLMREQNLPEKEASSCADDLIGKAQKLALAAQAKDKTLSHKNALTKAVSDAVDQSTMSKPDKNDLKNKLLSKLKQQMDKKPYINKDDLEPLKSQVLKDLKKIIDESTIPTAKKNELKSLLNEELAKTVDEIMDRYDDEEGYTKDYTKALSKAVNKTPMRNLEKSCLKKDLAKIFEGVMDDPDLDKITKHEEAFTKAINDAVDQSTLSKPDKKSLKNKLLNKMEETVYESPNINDTGALKAEILKDCKNVVDVFPIPMDQKDELKILLTEKIRNCYDDEEMEESPEYDDKISAEEAVSKSPDMDDYDEKAMEDKLKKYKEAFARAINHAVDQSSLSKPDKNNNKNKLLNKLNQTIDNSPNLNDIGALTAEVLKDSKNVVDGSSLPADKKKELKLLLQQAMEDASKELMEDEEISGEAFALFMDKIAETVKTWMDKLPIDLDPEDATAGANDIARDILDRQKYLQVHPEAVSSEKDEIENFKYLIFRRMKYLVDPKDIPPIMDGTEELYRMLMDLVPPPGFPKFGLRGLVDHN